MGILYVNKPKGITSFDVCFKLRKVLGTKKIGHTGTLDPNATGVIIVMFENDTKANQFLVSDYKEYIGVCRIGIETDTLDIDGKIIKQIDETMPSRNEIEAVFKSFTGTYNQIPPFTSAIKIDGKKLYEYQREGKEIDLKKLARKVEIKSLELLDINEKEFTFKTYVSSGTYIRSLLKDILDGLNISGTLLELTRTMINDISLNECNTLEDIEKGEYKVHDLYDVLSKRYEVIEIDDPKPVKDGKRLKLNSNEDSVLLVNNKKCLAIYQKDNNEYKSVRGLF